MKLKVFGITALILTLAFMWLIAYCPSDLIKISKETSTVNAEQRKRVYLNDDDYFDQLEKDLLRDEEEAKIKEAHEKSAKIQVSTKGNIIPKDLFNDEAFERLINELEHRNTDGYEFMAESANVTIYRRPKGNAGLYQYKLYAILPKSTPDQIISVFLDNDYRLVWDTYVTGLYHVKKANVGPDILYFNVDYPWPLANRDYVYAREGRKVIRNGREYITLVMHSVLDDNIPEEKSVIRVDDYHQSVVMTKFGKIGAKAYIEYYDDPKGSVPSWLVNWAAKTGVPSFLKDLQRACSGLNDFLEKHNRKMLTVPSHAK